MNRLRLIFGLAIAVMILLTACGTAPTEVPSGAPPAVSTEPASEEPVEIAIAIAIGGDPTTLDPQAADDGNERTVNDNIYETLLTRDQDMNIVPLLAESYEQINATTWRFNLRSDISFTNGEPLNAETVVYSINRVIDPEYNSEQLSFFETISGAEAVDSLTVDVFTSGPDPILPGRMYWLKIVPQEYASADAVEFSEAPIGTGPYMFVSWTRGAEIELVANPDYWGKTPTIDKVTIRIIPEESTRLAALQAGEVDLVRDLLPEQIDLAPKAVHTPGLEFPIVRLNNKEGPLVDVLLRQAMNFAVDKDAIAEALYGSYAVVAQGQVLTPGHTGYNSAVGPYPYDPDEARALLDEAGYDGSEIIFVGEAGRWLKDRELIEAIAAQLTDVGFNIKVEIYEWSKYLDYLFSEEEQPTMIYVSHDNVLLDADRTFSGYYSCLGRVSSYCNDRVTELIEAGRTETDVAARLAMYHEVVELSREDAAFIFLVNLENIYGLSEQLDWRPRLDGRILFVEMEEIH